MDQSLGNPITINSAANGYIDVAAISAWVTAHSVTTIYVLKVYDQADAQPLSALFPSFPPTLTLNVVGGLPAISEVASGRPLVSSGSATAQAQPVTVAGIIRYNTFSNAGAAFTDGTLGFDPLIQVGAATVSQAFGGTDAGYTGVADNTFASLISVANGASSSMSVNGTITAASPVNPGTNGIGSTNKLTMLAGQDNSGVALNGMVFEIIAKAGAASSTNQGLLTTNQRAIGTGF